MLHWLISLLPGILCAQTLPGTAPLEWKGDGAELIVDGIHRFLDSYQRPAGKPDSRRLAYILGVVEPRVNRGMVTSEVIARGNGYTVKTIEWESVEGLWGEGLLLEPNGQPRARVIAIGDAGWTPEMLAGLSPGAPSQFARRLAESGAQVIVPLLIDRKSAYSGVPGVKMSKIPHREFLWRQAFPLGRHIIGIEMQQVLAAVDWMVRQSPGLPVTIAGHGDGGLLALHAAALDPRIAKSLVTGYYGPRDQLWKEPVDRDVWGLFPDYRDEAVAKLIAPRELIVETAPPSDAALKKLLGASSLKAPQASLKDLRAAFDPGPRMQRQMSRIIRYLEHVIKESPKARAQFWAKADKTSPEHWVSSTRQIRDQIWDDLIGRLPEPSLPPNPRTRLIFDQPKYRGYEVVLDVWPNVNAYGYLLVPKDIRPGERRAAVVCQHGLEGRPKDVADPAVSNRTYAQFAVRLAEQGFVTFSPQNPYVLGDRFRQINRKAHPWKLSQFSFIAGQHARILQWLGSLDFIDARRIGFYGLSYGGFTAMRIPALLHGYALSICSGNFTEWVWKVASLDAPFTYPFTGEYEIPEFNFAHMVNHAELASLIFPRPFYVERGHKDGVSNDEWVAYEYAKVYRFYQQMGLKDRTAIEYFDGPHQIHGVGTYEFLKKTLMP
ncbi:MAG TPA: hypothetical protein VM120_29190 [Bryobacteraceae bacterium]|nr:hypothetical protein [Bryobacteraceae bacterium]